MATVQTEDDYELLAAIDFGTTFSGYAYSFKDSPKEIILNPEWGHEFGARSYKTSTCVLTNDKVEFVAFGYDALNKYTSDVDKKYDLYDRFKMALYKEKVVSSKTTVISRGGNIHPAETIITMALQYLYEHMKQHLQKSEGEIDEGLIKWVITVPAIWSEGAKQLMRRAAFKAGIIDKLESKRLLLALEPEAASFWCRNLPRNRLAKDKSASRSLPTGTTYMVVDCGGGTTDITIHEILEDGDIKEVHSANGGDWGGVKVDEEYMKLLDEVLGIKFTEKFKKSSPRHWFEMMVQFETKKRGYNTANETPISMSFAHKLVKAAGESSSKSIQEMVNEAKIQSVSYDDEQLVLQPTQVDKLFKPVVSQIVEHIDELFKLPSVHATSHIFLVGGLNCSSALTSQIKEKFGTDRTVTIPPDTGACVLKGAVLFGHTPFKVKSRIARKTYGQNVMEFFDSAKHDSRYKIVVDEVEYSKSMFEKWVTKGESIKVGECRKFITHPHSQSSTLAWIGVYAANTEAVTYTDEDGVVKIGELSLNTPDSHLPTDDRDIETSVYFGDTEMHVRVVDKAREDGDSAELTIDFLSE